MATPFTLVLSDLHLSAGPPTTENPLEDFVSDRAFATLLDETAAESQARGADVELILNGDSFDLLQVPVVDQFDPAHCYPPELYRGSTEAESARKLDLVIAGHPLLFDAMRRFLHPGPPRRSVTLVTGNHDLNLFWPAVQTRVGQALDATGDRRPLLTFEPRWARRGGLHVEHGNQYSEFVNRVPDMENPVDPEHPDRLALPPGSWFVTDLLNDAERDRYWIDGVKPVTALVFYALAYDFPFAARALALLLRRLPGMVLGGAGARDMPDVQPLLDRLEDPAAVESLAAQYQQDPAFRAQFNAQVERAISPPVSSEPAAQRAAALPDSVAMGERVREDQHSALYEAAARLAAEEGVRVVVLGHTHEPGEESLPGGAVYVNTGTWTWRGDFSQAGPNTWRELFEYPEHFTDDRDLSYLRVDYDDAGRPVARLLRQPTAPASAGGDWKSGLQSLVARFFAWLRAALGRLGART